MKGRIGILLGLLVVQLLIVAWVLFGRGDGAAATESFLDLDVATLTGVELSDKTDGEVSLVKGGGQWMVDNLPADGEKIQQVLDKLINAQAPWPVATTADAQERFEVTADAHQRKIKLLVGMDAVADVYLGTSPGYRRVHARREGTDAVFSIDFANHELPLDANDWLDKGLLAISAPITSINLQDQWQLTKRAEGWLLDDAAANSDAAAMLASRFAELQIVGRYAAAEDAHDTLQPKGVFVIDAGTKYTFTLAQETGGDRYAVSRDDVAGQFEVPTYIAEQMLATKESLEPVAAAATEAVVGSVEVVVEEVVDEVVEDVLGNVGTP